MKRRIALAVAALVLTAGCAIGDILEEGPTASVALEATSYVGVWAGHQSSVRYDLKPDGTFTATGVPVAHLGSLHERTGRVGPFHGHGQWKLDDPTEIATPIARAAVLTFDELLDTDDTRVEQRTVKLWACMPTHPEASHVLMMRIEDDWLQRPPAG
ncbi:hypothetical protein GCM10009827_092990 [Dactylosporangium maewongense]|uniref:Lipoprotein n=1 Tax=Dactylosporangium maewongense TaxID=634393 RepID=A0ABP4N7Z4_9ACTN